MLIGLAGSSTGVGHYGGRGRVVIEQVCYFPDSRRFLFTWVCVCVSERESVCVHVCICVT